MFNPTFIIFDSLCAEDWGFKHKESIIKELDPVGSTVRYEIMKLCTGSVKDSNGRYLMVLSQYKVVLVRGCS